MNRKPPRTVLRQLRQEVGFGCPIPECRKPFLTYHHFDPPWRVEQHHRPEGMIALCLEHAKMADAGLWSKEQQREFKRATHYIDDVKAHFPWATTEYLVRLGGNYAGGSIIPAALEGQPVLRLARSDNGILLLSFQLRAKDGRAVVSMDENYLSWEPDSLHDLEVQTGANRIRVTNEPRNVSLEFRFKQISLEELRLRVRDDNDRAIDHLESDPGIPKDLLQELRSKKASATGDGMVVQHARENCLDREGNIAFFDFERFVTHEQKRSLIIKDGIQVSQGGGAFGCFFHGDGDGIALSL